MAALRHVKALWPDDIVPSAFPVILFYEIDEDGDAVTRNVVFYADGRVTRNSIEVEERSGNRCPSLINCSLERGFEGADMETVTVEAFEDAWNRGIDTPFWNVA